MLPVPIDYVFEIDHQRYRLVEWTRGGEKRIRAEYASALVVQAPDLVANLERPDLPRDPARAAERLGALARQLSLMLETLDGQDLYAEAVARECLREAPELFWETRPAPGGANGASVRVPTFDQVPRRLWDQFREGVQAFLALIFPAVPATLEPLLEPVPGDAGAVAPAQALPAGLRGRAE
jgi:hypothetical protein